MRDVIVVGAGPSGSYASYSLSRRGYDVLNLEEHLEVGKPVECTGLVSERVTHMVRTKSEVNTVTGAHVIFPNGERIHVKKREKTIVLDRDSFDKDCAAQSIGAGTDLCIGSRVKSVKVTDQYASVTYRENGDLKEERTLAVIGADGINSRVRRDLFPSRTSRIVSGYQVDSAHRLEDQDSVEVYVGSRVSRGFFGWATPAGNITRIGVGARGGASLKYFRNLNSKFGDNKILGINGGAIPISYLRKTYANRAMLVGDAAGIVKPLSGGGIYTGMVSGSHAADAFDRAYEREDFGIRQLAWYQKAWKRDLGLELWFDGMFQRIYSTIGDSSFNTIHSVLSRPEVISLINKTGDIDYPSKVVVSVLVTKPWLLRYLIPPRKA